MKKGLILVGIMSLLMACQHQANTHMIKEESIQQALTSLQQTYPNADLVLAERGVRQVAALWQEADGAEADFVELVTTHYAATEEEKKVLYDRLSHILEQCGQSADLLNNTLQEPTTLVGKGEPSTVDWIISGYSPMAHFAEDMFANKIAHICVLNFPHYTLEEKNTLGKHWSRQEWAYARLGDVFSNRVPGSVVANYSQALSEAENYIAGYNIMMHSLRNEQGEPLWTEPMALLSHWNLRDELKSNYAAVPHAHEKQEMIYQVMLRIIRQEIPQCVINSDQLLWCPITNHVSGKPDSDIKLKVDVSREPDTRYQQIINIFHAAQQIDAYRSDAPTHVLRTFNEDLEIPMEEIEALFTQLIESEEIKQVAQIIRERLGRELRPYDIWYDGFKSRSTISEDVLTKQTQKRYPDAKAFEKDMPRMLMDLGFAREKAREVASHIVVEAARGSGHARPCVGREQPARLRTRVGNKGMDYKGYNIAVHEFGHNVEEVISLYDIDYYTLAGIPNTGFTEASAFLFQERDLQLMGYSSNGQNADALLDQGYQFDFYDGGGLDLCYLGLAECDPKGCINVSRFGPRIAGCGGFINITQCTPKVFFCGTFTAGGLKVKVEDGKVVIVQEGKQKKFVKSVEQITFNGDIANERGQQVMYMTERCVFVLKEDGLHLTEIAPGIDLQTQILDQMEFAPIIDRDENGEIKLMPASLFAPGLMGLKEMKA